MAARAPAFDDLPEASPREQRREGERFRTVLRVGKLIAPDGEELCLIRNLSAGGLMARVYSDHAVHQRVVIELRGGQTLAGQVRWAKSGSIGVQFDEAVDPIAILAADPLEACGRARAPRVNAHRPATMKLGETMIEAETRDLSQHGAKLACGRAIATDTTVAVTIAGFETKRCDVRWSHDGLVGVSFHQPLDLGSFMAGLRTR